MSNWLWVEPAGFFKVVNILFGFLPELGGVRMQFLNVELKCSDRTVGIIWKKMET